MFDGYIKVQNGGGAVEDISLKLSNYKQHYPIFLIKVTGISLQFNSTFFFILNGEKSLVSKAFDDSQLNPNSTACIMMNYISITLITIHIVVNVRVQPLYVFLIL